MIATVTLNPCLDEYIFVDGLVVDETNRWVKRHQYAGGKGIDVARAIHEMDGVTTAYGFIGGNNGRRVEILLDEEGVLFSFTPIKNETRTNFVLVDKKTKYQTIIGAPGPRVSRKELERFCHKLQSIRPVPDMMCIGGSAPPGAPDNIYSQIISGARERGIKVVFDVAGKWLAEGLTAKPYLIKPNVHEAEELLGKTLEDEKAVIRAAMELVNEGIEIVLISRGSNGLIAASRDNIYRVIPPKVTVKSAVGAGDCTVAGFALRLSRNEPLIAACRLGGAMGAAAVITPGTELCRRKDVERLLPKVKIEEISEDEYR
ncbi:MAG: 1-phosphofructokinase [Dehalococcoidales bacterium]|nr:1-phosphofructokinase [Dehalococcoidales bacterium]